MYKPVVHSNVVQSLITLIKAMALLSIEYENETVSAIASDFIIFVQGRCSNSIYSYKKMGTYVR